MNTQMSCFSAFVFPIILLRAYVSPEDKLKYSNAVPSRFDEIICGLILGDGSLRINGNLALLSVQQVHSELVTNLWDICFSLHLVINPVKTLAPISKQIVYYFLLYLILLKYELFGIQYLTVRPLSHYRLTLMSY